MFSSKLDSDPFLCWVCSRLAPFRSINYLSGFPKLSLKLTQTISQTIPDYLSNYPKRSLNYPRLSLRLSQTVSTNVDFSKYEECQKNRLECLFFLHEGTASWRAFKNGPSVSHHNSCRGRRGEIVKSSPRTELSILRSPPCILSWTTTSLRES